MVGSFLWFFDCLPLKHPCTCLCKERPKNHLAGENTGRNALVIVALVFARQYTAKLRCMIIPQSAL